MSGRQWPLPCSEEELLSIHVAGPHSQDKGLPGIVTCDPFYSRSSLPLSCSWKGTRGGVGLSQVRPETTSSNTISQVGTMTARLGKQLLLSPGGSNWYDMLRRRLVEQERMAPVRRDRCRLSGLAQPGLGLCPLTGTGCKLEQGVRMAGQAAGAGVHPHSLGAL